MSPKKDNLTPVEPVPVADETTPLLGESQPDANGTLEAQARQEQREHDANTTPIADEPSKTKLALTMGSLWLCTFFAALGKYIHKRCRISADILQTQRLSRLCQSQYRTASAR